MNDERETWPVTYDDLEPHYERHERMLSATPYPYETDPAKRVAAREPYDRTYKTRAMQLASEKLGLEWYLPKLAVAFSAGGEPKPGVPILDEPANLHGQVRLTCRLCGECNVGCNYGSKNTLDFTYLSDAALRHGAHVHTRCEVKSFAPRQGGGYTVDLRRPLRRGRGREAHGARPPSTRSAATGSSSPPASSARRICCSRTATRSPGSATGWERASPATATSS